MSLHSGSVDADDPGVTYPLRRGVLIPVADWQPVGVEDLEPEGWAALRDNGNAAVVAGPGAGKTEFLAQRAAYLLQTGLCRPPHRILAISFKRDAAANLGRRVRARVPDHAHRFVSMTFDAFTKGLVDRFAPALPADWRMSVGYEMRFPSDRDIGNFLSDILPVTPAPLRPAVGGLRANRFLADVVGTWNLPVIVPASDPDTAVAYAALAWWRAFYLRPGTVYVNFAMLNRLAELLVRTVPRLRRALRITYPFVFVDEFQDTTNAQFSFLESVFGGGPVVTVVGDDNQRIMGWAGALPRAVQRFTTTFDGSLYRLKWNFRSSDPLVQLQHVIAFNLNATSTPALSKVAADSVPDPAMLWTFSGLDREAAFIADWIAQDIANSGRRPADYALIARQKIGDFEPRFRHGLLAHGIRVRNDDAQVGKMRLQDLLKNETARLLLGLLQLANQPYGLIGVWNDVATALARVDGAFGDEDAERRISENLTHLTRTLRDWLGSHPPGTTPAAEVIDNLLGVVDTAALRRYAKSTAPDEDFTIVINAFTAHLAAVIDIGADWSDVLEQIECRDAVVLLTAHRSKGLEYHTVFFLGLDDQQWWAYARDPGEATSTFFVGLSRAAQQLIFTTTTPHARTGGISTFFDMLDDAGVPEIDQG